MSDPIFSTIDDTKKRQRLDGLEGGHTVLEQLDLVIDDARGVLYARLGLSRLGTLVGLAPADPPTTDNEYLALIAATTEQKMVRRGLLHWISMLAKEGSGGRIYQEWSNVSAFRGMTAATRLEEVKRLDDEIEQAMGILSGSVTPGEQKRGKAVSIGSELADKYRKVGFSLYAVPAYIFHFSLDTSNE